MRHDHRVLPRFFMVFDNYVYETADGVVLRIRVRPRSSRTAFVGTYGENALKFNVAAPPVDGEANEMLCAYLAEQLHVPKNAVLMISGAGSRDKRILIKGIAIENVNRFLSQFG